MSADTPDLQQLAKKVKLFEAIVNRANDGIIVFNHKMETMFANAAAGKILGLPAPELRGKPLSRFIPEELRTKHDKLVHLFSASNEERQELDDWRKLRCARYDGTLFPCRISVQKIAIYGNTAFIVTLQDMSEYYIAEQRKCDAELSQFQLEQQKRCVSNTLQSSLEASITKIAKNAQSLKENIQVKTVQDMCQNIMTTAFNALTLSQKAAYFSADGTIDTKGNSETFMLIDRSVQGIFDRIRGIVDPVATEKKLNTLWEIPQTSKEFKLQNCATVEQVFFNIAEHAIRNAIGGEILFRVPQVGRTDEGDIEIEFHCSLTHFGVPQYIIDQALSETPDDAAIIANSLENKGRRLRLANHLTNKLGGKMRVISHPTAGTEIFIKLIEPEFGLKKKTKRHSGDEEKSGEDQVVQLRPNEANETKSGKGLGQAQKAI
jgi:PAS domain S-box-containing protein